MPWIITANVLANVPDQSGCRNTKPFSRASKATCFPDHQLADINVAPSATIQWIQNSWVYSRCSSLHLAKTYLQTPTVTLLKKSLQLQKEENIEDQRWHKTKEGSHHFLPITTTKLSVHVHDFDHHQLCAGPANVATTARRVIAVLSA
jgi:hypothetical protein